MSDCLNIPGVIDPMARMVELIPLFADAIQLPYCSVIANDTPRSNLIITASFDPKEKWDKDNLYHSRYFILSVISRKNRYYNKGDTLMISGEHFGIGGKLYRVKPFWRHLGDPDFCVAHMQEWIDFFKKYIE